MKMKKWLSQWTQFIQLRKEAWKKDRELKGMISFIGTYEPTIDLLPASVAS